MLITSESSVRKGEGHSFFLVCPIPLHFQQTFTLLPVAALKTYTEGGPSSLKSTEYTLSACAGRAKNVRAKVRHSLPLPDVLGSRRSMDP